MSKLQGSCLCGSVRYEIEAEPVKFMHCHCQRCRKASGTGHASNLRFPGDCVTWLSGKDLIGSYKVPEAERFRNDFCTKCGSSLPRYMPSIDATTVPAGTLDDEPSLRPDARIFLGSKTSWSCEDSIPGFETMPQ
jgi:hypothetical protein